MVHPSQRNSLYSARKPAWFLTFKRGDTAQHYRVRAWLVAPALMIFVLLLAGYVGATGYLIYRDDILAAAVSHQVRMQYGYEERIAALRAELDRLSSRHAVQTETVEQQLGTLLEQQALIDRRQTSLDALVGQSRAAGVAVASGDPRVPRSKPDAGDAAAATGIPDTPPPGYSQDGPTDGDEVSELPLRGGQPDHETPTAQPTAAAAPPAGGTPPTGKDAAAAADAPEIAPLSYAAPDEPVDDVISNVLLRGGKADREAALNAARPILKRIGSSLDRAEARQSDALNALSAVAGSEADRLNQALVPIGAHLAGPADEESEPQGGPFIPATGLHFVERAALLKRTLDGIDSLRRSAEALPLKVPVKALYLSSRFGFRVDPFLKRPAFHAGLDLVAEPGTVVRATAAGTVVSAGWSGGYGEMVEITHADGMSTRYGHLSETLVTPGTHVEAGTPIGRVGSTGRSTGPHLHYETRRDGKAVDPALYLAAGAAFRGGSTLR